MHDNYAIWPTSTTATSTIAGTVMWNGWAVIDDDGDGTAGVRAPRHPAPAPLAPTVIALELIAGTPT